MADAALKKQPNGTRTPTGRKYVSQEDVPRHSLEEALRVPRAIQENFALEPTRPLSVAQALDVQPHSSGFRTLCGAAIAYGLTQGGAKAPRISVTPLAKRILEPTEEADDLKAMREAILGPRVAREFLKKYDGRMLPRDDIARNVLVELGVARPAAARCLALILDNAKHVAVLRTIKGSTYVDLQGSSTSSSDTATLTVVEAPPSNEARPQPPAASHQPPPAPKHRKGAKTSGARSGDDPTDEAVPPVRPFEPSQSQGVDDGPLRRGLQVDAYTLQERLGTGFSAEVWAATVAKPPHGVQVAPGQRLAIKFYHAHAMALPDQVIRIEREFRIAQKIRHPNLIRIYEFVLASSRPHHNFLVMDVAPGKSLKEIIPPTGLSVQKCLQIAKQILLALEPLHSEGALHRDVKPGNVAVADEPNGMHAVLLDLGIVTVLHERSLTAASRFLGSKHWAPYEQLVGDPLDRRSDIYSVGAVLYNMLTGDEPYPDKGTEAAVAIEMNKKPLRLPDNVNVPDDVRKLINACLETNRVSRPQSVGECLRALSAHG